MKQNDNNIQYGTKPYKKKTEAHLNKFARLVRSFGETVQQGVGVVPAPRCHKSDEAACSTKRRRLFSRTLLCLLTSLFSNINYHAMLFAGRGELQMNVFYQPFCEHFVSKAILMRVVSHITVKQWLNRNQRQRTAVPSNHCQIFLRIYGSLSSILMKGFDGSTKDHQLKGLDLVRILLLIFQRVTTESIQWHTGSGCKGIK